MPARHGRAALQPDRRRRARRRGRAASMRRSARTRRCSPIWCAACSRTAPTRRSSIASPTPSVPIEALIEDPVAAARAIDPVGAPHPKIALPRDLFAPERGRIPPASTSATRRVSPRSRNGSQASARNRLARRRARPARRGRSSIRPIPRDVVGQVVDADASDVERAFAARGAGRAGLGGARAGRTRARSSSPPRRASKPKRSGSPG